MTVAIFYNGYTDGRAALATLTLACRVLRTTSITQRLRALLVDPWPAEHQLSDRGKLKLLEWPRP